MGASRVDTGRAGAPAAPVRRAGARGFLKREDGASTVDFVLIVGPLLAVFLLVIDLSVSYFMGQTLGKAAQMGARLAAVSSPAAAGLPTTNAIRDGGEAGLPCSDDSAPCRPPAQLVWSCTGGGASCDAAAFNAILGEVRRLAGLVQPDNLTVRYEYAELGRAGGPFTPAIIVEITEVPSPVGFLSAVRATFRLDTDLSVLPPVRAVVLGEDLNAGPS